MLAPVEFESKLNFDQINNITDTLPSDSMSMTINYPTGKSKNNICILGFSIYRNANYVYDPRVLTITRTNAGLYVEINSSYTYIQGCQINIYYA